MFIVMAIIYSSYPVLANGSDGCDCNVLQLNGPKDMIGQHNFTKQSDSLNEKPYLFSTKQNLISWNIQKQHWCYYKYNDDSNLFESKVSYPGKRYKMPFEKFVKNNLSRHRHSKKYIKATTAF